jgi:hypothetical protein
MSSLIGSMGALLLRLKNDIEEYEWVMREIYNTQENELGLFDVKGRQLLTRQKPHLKEIAVLVKLFSEWYEGYEENLTQHSEQHQ